MVNPETQNISLLLQEIEQEQTGDFQYERDEIEKEITHGASVLKTLSIKLLLILGGLLASSTFIGFFMAAGLYESGIGLILFGSAFLIGAELLVRYKDDSAKDAIGVSLNITGYMLLAMGTGQLTENTTVVALTLAGLALLVIVFSESAICVFLGVLIFSQSLVGLIVIHEVYYLSHALVIVLAGVLTYMSLHEAKLISGSPKLNLKYGPVRMGVIFSLVVTLALFVHQKLLSTNIEQFWISSLFLIGCLLVLIYHILKNTAVTARATVVIYICCILLLTPTLFTPSVPGALLIMLSSFYIGHKPGFWVGLLALAYFVILYYYDLNMTLLMKSVVLMVSGLLFLGGFVLLNRYLKSYAD